MTLTADEVRHAERHGWTLAEVYDPEQRRVMWSVLPVAFIETSVPAMTRHVIELAKRGDTVAIKALTMIAKSNIYGRSKRKK